MTYYILRKDGAYAGVSLWEGYEKGKPHKIAVHDGTRRSEVTVPLLKGFSQDFPTVPDLAGRSRKVKVGHLNFIFRGLTLDLRRSA